MGNSNSGTTAPRARSASPSSTRRQRRAIDQPAAPRRVTVAAPTRSRRRASVTKGALPRDPTTGRYLPRGQRTTAASPPSRVPRTTSPRRRVQIEVITTPQSEVHDQEEMERAVRAPRARRAAVLNAAAISPPAVKKAASPRRGRPAKTAAPQDPPAVPATSSSPILKSSYTRARSASPPAAVSRRDYASPSLAAPQVEAPTRGRRRSATPQTVEAPPQENVVIGPSTTRRMRKMATTPVSQIATESPPALPTSTLQIEKLAHTAPKVENPTDLLFSYLNAA